MLSNSARRDRLADHAGDVLKRAGCAQQAVAQPDCQHAHDAQQDTGHIGRPFILADVIDDLFHGASLLRVLVSRQGIQPRSSTLSVFFGMVQDIS